MLLAGELLDLPQGFMTIPGSGIGLLAVMTRDASGGAVLALQGLSAPADGSGESRSMFLVPLRLGGSTDPALTAGYAISWPRAGAFTGMVVKNDPGQGIIWTAFASLIAGLVLTFYFPRRRVWARIEGGRVMLALTADRYVDTQREFRDLLDALAASTGQRALISNARW